MTRPKNSKCDTCGLQICGKCHSHIFVQPYLVWQAHADLKHGKKVMACLCPRSRREQKGLVA